MDYVRVLIDRQKYLRAHEEIDFLLRLEPDNRDYLSLYAAACVGLGRHESAIALYRAAARRSRRRLPNCMCRSATLSRAVGRQKEAIESYRMAAAVKPSFGDAYWSLANLKTYRFSENEIVQHAR